MRISDWSSDVCSSDLHACQHQHGHEGEPAHPYPHFLPDRHSSGTANVVHPSHAHTTYPWAATGGTMRDTLSDESGKTLLPEITGYTLLRAIGHGGMSTVYLGRSEARRAGKECVSTFSSRCSP